MAKRVLVAPLNWGLGHATRCIPVIHALHDLGCEVVLASDGRALDLLRLEFPSLTAVSLPSYGITYPDKMHLLQWLVQVPRLKRIIRKESEATADLVKDHCIDCIISDNRYGVFHPEIPSAFITHQLNLPLPLLSEVVSRQVQKLVQRFDECWIPDVEGDQALSGALSAPELTIKKKYLGLLSRFGRKKVPVANDLLAIISGPEPDRTRFEELVLTQLNSIPGPHVLVQGKPEAHQTKDTMGTTIYSAKWGTELNELINQSAVVVCRAGYSSIMDLVCLGKRAILVPTPHQPEQQYLARHLADHPQFEIQAESDFDLAAGLENLQGVDLEPRLLEEQLHSVIAPFLQ